MKNDYYICEFYNTCSFRNDEFISTEIGNKGCAFSRPTSKNSLDSMCGGTFHPQARILCGHPSVNKPVYLNLVSPTKSKYMEKESIGIKEKCISIWP